MVSLNFHDCVEERDFITTHVSVGNDLVLEFNLIGDDDKLKQYHMYFDKSTAIKLSKELRKQIALIE